MLAALTGNTVTCPTGLFTPLAEIWIRTSPTQVPPSALVELYMATALPLLSVMALAGVTVPQVALNDTGKKDSGSPVAVLTNAET